MTNWVALHEHQLKKSCTKATRNSFILSFHNRISPHSPLPNIRPMSPLHIRFTKITRLSKSVSQPSFFPHRPPVFFPTHIRLIIIINIQHRITPLVRPRKCYQRRRNSLPPTNNPDLRTTNVKLWSSIGESVGWVGDVQTYLLGAEEVCS